MKLSIIIVSWNGKRWLKDCLESIWTQTFKDFEVIFVDNDSRDGSADFVERNYPDTVIIRNKENLGFGPANNIGAKKAKGDVLFLLNNDTVIDDTRFLEKALELKKERGLQIAGPKILNFQREDIYQGRKLSIDCTGYLGWGKTTFYVEGCAMFIDRELFLKLKGFDKTNFAYSEDIDLCWRAHLLGKKVDILPEISIVHFGGGTSETTQIKTKEKHVVPLFRKYEVEKNNLRNIIKNYSALNLFWTIPLFLIQLPLESLVYLFTGNCKILKYIAKAIWWNIDNVEDTLEERVRVQETRIVNDWKILKKMSFGINKPRAFLIIGMPRFK